MCLLLKCRPMISHLGPHVQGSIFLKSKVSALHLNADIPFSYLTSEILCVPPPSNMCVAQPPLSSYLLHPPKHVLTCGGLHHAQQ